MKTKFLSIFLLISLFSFNNYSQTNDAEFNSRYVMVTKLHGHFEVNANDWMTIEQEFYDKVISKNKYITGHEILVDYYKKDLSEIVIIKIYNSWDDIEKSRKETQKLIEKAWPDKNLKQAFFDKQNNYFDFYYSNEIFLTNPSEKLGTKDIKRKNDAPQVFRVVNNKLADYDYDDSLEAYNKYVKNVIYNNSFIKAYFTLKHFIGSDSRNFIELYVADSYGELQKSFDKDKELLKKLVPEEAKRNEFIEVYNRGIEKMNNKLYKNIPSMSK